MKLRLLLLALAVAIVPVSLPAADAPKPPAAKPERPETELEKTMSKMGKAWREVRKNNLSAYYLYLRARRARCRRHPCSCASTG